MYQVGIHCIHPKYNHVFKPSHAFFLGFSFPPHLGDFKRWIVSCTEMIVVLEFKD